MNGNLIGAFAPIIQAVCQNETGGYVDPLLRSSAVLALSKMMCLSPGFWYPLFSLSSYFVSSFLLLTAKTPRLTPSARIIYSSYSPFYQDRITPPSVPTSSSQWVILRSDSPIYSNLTSTSFLNAGGSLSLACVRTHSWC